MVAEKDWHESDRFWESLRPVLFSNSRIENASVEVDALIRLAECEPGASVLDLACGVGRHSLELARRGFAVTGVDRTAAYIEEAKERASALGLAVEFVEADMRTFVRDDTYDLAVCLFTSLGYFEDREDDGRVVENVARSLKPGGEFIVDVMGREVLKRVFLSRNWKEEDGAILLEDTVASDEWDRVDNRWVIIRGDERREVTFSLHVYSADELADLLKEGGLEVTGIYGWYDGSLYNENALRLIAVARKQ